ncbi:DUF2129 domain-containing protein [Streptococcus cuniculipharyngis]|uniref:UPF0298 protein FRX57_06715 n=1 Tax=Streptococcus cuniculipharyngis TaxID=1562651 RepID=A0A5C5SAF7_9STRE|nr:DUF2129 domain-containing protein [Streptococcus cuniculipharyngis]TWS96651.1 DUF2129 domain-containing protein [Streptococcus cuniculipharyngis]
MFQKQKRQGLIIYLYYNRDAKKLETYGDLIYHSKKMKYVLLYLNQERVSDIGQQLQQLKFVKHVQESYLEEIDSNFVGNLSN